MVEEQKEGPDRLICRTGRAGIVFERIPVVGRGVVLQARPLGYNRADEVTEIMQRMMAHDGFSARLPTLWDFRDHDFEAYRMSEFRAHAFILRSLPQRTGARRGHLVNSDIGYGMMRMFQQASSGYLLEASDRFRVSYSRDKLLHWLTDDSGNLTDSASD